MNILSEINEKRISEEEAYDLILKITKDVHAGKYPEFEENNSVDLAKILEMDNYEYTAYCQGAGLFEITKWRYEGWPTKCAESNIPFNYKNYGWIVQEINDESKLVLLNQG